MNHDCLHHSLLNLFSPLKKWLWRLSLTSHAASAYSSHSYGNFNATEHLKALQAVVTYQRIKALSHFTTSSSVPLHKFTLGFIPRLQPTMMPPANSLLSLPNSMTWSGLQAKISLLPSTFEPCQSHRIWLCLGHWYFPLLAFSKCSSGNKCQLHLGPCAPLGFEWWAQCWNSHCYTLLSSDMSLCDNSRIQC